MKVSLKDLRSAPGQRLKLRFSESMPGEETIEPIVGDITLVANSALVKLEGSIQTIVKLQCHSCLEYFLHALDIDINEEFVYEDYLSVEPLSVRERELQKQDFFEVVPYHGTIDISDVVFQTVLLAIPSYCSCGPNCSGPPVYNRETTKNSETVHNPALDQSGKEKWTDPRWHNLKTILPNDDKNKK